MKIVPWLFILSSAVSVVAALRDPPPPAEKP